VCTASGEPSFVQTVAYFAADFFGRVLRMMPFRISHQTGRGISTTRGPRGTASGSGAAGAVGALGVPRLIRRTAVRAGEPWW
jgi:hypothetical protein